MDVTEMYHAAIYIASGAAAALALAKAYRSLFAPNLTYRHEFSEDGYRGTSVLTVKGKHHPKFHDDVFQKIIPRDTARTFEEMVDVALNEIRSGQILESSGIDPKMSISELVIQVRQ